MRIKYLNAPFIFIFGITLIALHIFFLIIGNYYKIWWADMVLHFSGGFLVGMFAIWFIFNYSSLPIEKNRLPFYIILISVLGFAALVGVLWEFYEFALDKITGYKSYSIIIMQENMADTMSDLLLDLIGAAASSVFLKFKK